MKSFVSPSCLALVAILSLAAVTMAPAQTYTVLHSFPETATDGAYPWSPMIFDDRGNLYGVTRYGGDDKGSDGDGTLFEVDASGVEIVLHQFSKGATEGQQPFGPIVRFGGKIYGTTFTGTGSKCGHTGGCGTIFQYSRGKETILYSFTDLEGNSPHGLTHDSLGNLYGTTAQGGTGTHTPDCGAQGCGGVFEFSQGKETVLYTFLGQPDGKTPNGELLVDRAGNLFGTTQLGGAFNHGALFELSSNGDGTWSETILYSFRGNSDGSQPGGGVIMDAKGNLYGSTLRGGLRIQCVGSKGKTGCGVVYKMVKNTDGSWTERAVYHFGGSIVGDGAAPIHNLVRDDQGNLYGATNNGGENDFGTIFEINPDGTEKILKRFSNTSTDGLWPSAGLTMDASGNLYGVASYGGTSTPYAGCYSGCGVVFKITP